MAEEISLVLGPHYLLSFYAGDNDIFALRPGAGACRPKGGSASWGPIISPTASSIWWWIIISWYWKNSQLTNKYAEGYPGKRYYGGCEYVDIAESLALERLKLLFAVPGVEFAANVQPHSGAQANTAVLLALLNPGDTIMGLSLAEGGHLTHGMALNISGKWFKVVSYGLNDREEVDYDAMERLAHDHKPKLIIAGASAYSLRFDWARFARVARDVGAYLMVDMAHYAGLIAAGVYPSPGSPRRCCHEHHSQDAARAARRPDTDEAAAGESDQQRGIPRASRADR